MRPSNGAVPRSFSGTEEETVRRSLVSPTGIEEPFMISLHRCRGRVARIIGAAFLLSVVSTAQAQFFRQAVGGISIDPKGVLANARHDANGLRQFWLDLLKPVPEDLTPGSKLRKISLRGLAEL